MGILSVFSTILVVFSIYFNPIVVGQGNMCGVAAPDPMKTCISLRLPWQAEPIYFCIEKDKFRYKNQCGHPHMTHCGTEMRNDTLLLATPWECCPYSSVPDHCMHMHCPQAPHNRTCKMLDDNSNMMEYHWGAGDCCPKYYCEDNTTPETCHVKRLEPMCVTPPKDKMNCVGFYDPYGCCTKYQCDGEGKPGMCPMQHQAMQFAMRLNSTHHYMMNMTMGMGMMNGGGISGMPMSANLMQAPSPPPASDGSGSPPPAESAEASAPEVAAQSSGDAEVVKYSTLPMKRPGVSSQYTRMSGMSMYSNSHFSMQNTMHQCVGDFNCPGTMKCCSHDMTVYADGHFMMKNMHPTSGYCVEPVMMAPMQ